MAAVEAIDYTYPPRISRERRLPWKTAAAAFLLFATGTILLMTSFHFLGVDNWRGLTFAILGGLTFIPGSYATFQLYGAWKGWRGYDYNDVPSYDDII